MYTRCPKCKTAYRITLTQLRSGHGEALCERCHTVFDALESLAQNVRESIPGEVPPVRTPVLGDHQAVVVPKFEREGRDEFIAERLGKGGGNRSGEPPSSGRVWPWGLGSLGLLLVLVGQGFYFEWDRLAQNATTRPGLERLCSWVGCHLRPFRDLRDIRIIDRGLSVTRSGELEFRMIFVNESGLPQAFPELRLVLNELSGRPLATRVFKPSEYLPDDLTDAWMVVGKPVEVHLLLARPKGEVGGFSFELV